MFEIEFKPEEELKAVHEGLRVYNRQFFKTTEDLSCGIMDENGVCIAGALVWRADELAMVDILWVDEAHRKHGLGEKILSAVEEKARKSGVKYLELNTFGFQAPRFYEKLGFRQFGALERCIGAYGHYHFVKELN